MNMMDAITCLAIFFNYSPQRQKELEHHLMANTVTFESQKSKLLPLCRTRWVERLDALDVTLDLLDETLLNISQHTNKQWNRDTTTQASALLKRMDFEFTITLIITQKILSFTAGITTSLQKKGIDIAKAYEDVQRVIQTLEHVRSNIESFYNDWFMQGVILARKLDVEVRKSILWYNMCAMCVLFK